MSNLILGVTPTKRLTHKLYIGLETNWTLKENNQIAKAAPPKTIFQNVHTEVFVEPRGQASDKISYSYSKAWTWNPGGKSRGTSVRNLSMWAYRILFCSAIPQESHVCVLSACVYGCVVHIYSTT